MSGIGETLRHERQRQGRTLADAAAETRVRESYLAAIEDEDFDVLGGDVYARGFIRLYGKYLGLDADDLVQRFRTHHEKPAEVTAIPGATIDEVMAPMGGLRELAVQPPVMTAVGVVVLLVLLFLVFRGGGDEVAEVDPNAPGPSPAATDGAGEDLAEALSEGETALGDPAQETTDVPTPGDLPTATATPSTDASGGEVVGGALEDLQISVTALAPLQLTVLRGQPPVTGAPLDVGETRNLFDPEGQEVRFTVSDFGAAEITVNGDLLLSDQLDGQAVEITCTVGEAACDAVIL